MLYMVYGINLYKTFQLRSLLAAYHIIWTLIIPRRQHQPHLNMNNACGPLCIQDPCNQDIWRHKLAVTSGNSGQSTCT